RGQRDSEADQGEPGPPFATVLALDLFLLLLDLCKVRSHDAERPGAAQRLHRPGAVTEVPEDGCKLRLDLTIRWETTPELLEPRPGGGEVGHAKVELCCEPEKTLVVRDDAHRLVRVRPGAQDVVVHPGLRERGEQ